MDKELDLRFQKFTNNANERVSSKLFELVKSNEVEFDTHCHFFNKDYIPENYFGLRFPIHSKKFLENAEKFLDFINPFDDDDKMSHYSYFIKFINRDTIEVADYFLSIHSPNTIFCPLMMNMQYGIEGAVEPFSKQMEEMLAIKKKYPRQILPFVAIDPNSPDARRDFNQAFSKEYDFFGVKIYPALGYLPSHPMLMDVFEICEKKGIPVVTHCGGDSVHTTKKKMTIPYMDFDKNNQLQKYSEEVKFQVAKDYGDYFNNPSRWEPVLRAFPKLKLNFGHFGGSSQWKDLEYNKIDNRVLRIIDLMLRFKNVYSDVSFLISDSTVFDTFIKYFNQNKILQERTLFGSDFFLVVTEGKYKNMRVNFRLQVGDDIYNKIARDNPRKFLFDL